MGRFDDAKTEPSRTVPVAAFLTLADRRVRSEHEVGDGWEHEIRLEQLRPMARDESLADFPRCLAGRRARPPQDRGGTLTYQTLLAILLAILAAGEFDPADGDDPATGLSLNDPEAFDPATVHFDDPFVRLRHLFASR